MAVISRVLANGDNPISEWHSGDCLSYQYSDFKWRQSNQGVVL